VRLKNESKSLMNGRMTGLSDTLTVGLILVLLFGAVVLYLYTRLQQAEHKISLLESILLDLKMSTEIHSYSELPASEHGSDSKGPTESTPEEYVPFIEENEAVSNNLDESSPKPSSPTPSLHEEEIEVEQYKSVIEDAIANDTDVTPQSTSKTTINYESPSVNYDILTLKELQSLAKSRGITGAGSMKKGPIIEALKTSDKTLTNIGSSPFGSVSSSFLETSSSFPSNESA